MSTFIFSWVFMVVFAMITTLVALVIIVCASAYIFRKYTDNVIDNNCKNDNSGV